MSENLGNLLWGCLSVAAGAVMLHYLDAVVRFDQNSGMRMKALFNKRLGKSVLNLELWSVGTETGFRSSKVVFRIVAYLAILFGMVLIGLAFRGHFH
jgi:hypothetical protein